MTTPTIMIKAIKTEIANHCSTSRVGASLENTLQVLLPRALIAGLSIRLKNQPLAAASLTVKP